MKLKIFLVWLVLAAFSRSLIQIPVFGGWIVGAIALLPVLWVVVSVVKGVETDIKNPKSRDYWKGYIHGSFNNDR